MARADLQHAGGACDIWALAILLAGLPLGSGELFRKDPPRIARFHGRSRIARRPLQKAVVFDAASDSQRSIGSERLDPDDADLAFYGQQSNPMLIMAWHAQDASPGLAGDEGALRNEIATLAAQIVGDGLFRIQRVRPENPNRPAHMKPWAFSSLERYVDRRRGNCIHCVSRGGFD
jgi:hypothetical protein